MVRQKRMAHKSVGVVKKVTTLQEAASDTSVADSANDESSANNNDTTNTVAATDGTTTNNNTTTASTSSTNNCWPVSARERWADLEDQLRNAPPLDAVRVYMVVGFAVSHSNGLNVAQRTGFQASLLHCLRQKGLIFLNFNNQVMDLEPVIRGHLTTLAQHLVFFEHQQQAIVAQRQRMEQIQRQRAAVVQQVQQQQSQSLPKKAKRGRPSKTDIKENKDNPKEETTGPAKPVEGCPDLAAAGWTQRTVSRGGQSGRVDHYWYTPVNKCILRSKSEIKRFYQFYLDPNDECYQDEGKAAQKAKRLGKRKYNSTGGSPSPAKISSPIMNATTPTTAQTSPTTNFYTQQNMEMENQQSTEEQKEAAEGEEEATEEKAVEEGPPAVVEDAPEDVNADADTEAPAPEEAPAVEESVPNPTEDTTPSTPPGTVAAMREEVSSP